MIIVLSPFLLRVLSNLSLFNLSQNKKKLRNVCRAHSYESDFHINIQKLSWTKLKSL